MASDASHSEVLPADVLRADVAVVGAGPAGMAAAVAAADGGLDVVVVDAGAHAGGQYWRQPALVDDAAPALPGTDGTTPTAATAYERSRSALAAHQETGRVRLMSRHQVWMIERRPGSGAPGSGAPGSGAPGSGAQDGPDAEPAGVLLRLVAGAEGDLRQTQVTLVAERVVLTPGAYDRHVPFPGWTLPGVMAAGGVQAMLKEHGVLPGRRAVVAGTGPFLLPVATALLQAGGQVAEICEASSGAGWLRSPGALLRNPSRGIEGVAYARAVARHRVPVRPRHVVVAALGEDRLEAVRIARVDRHGRVVGQPRTVQADLLAVGWGFTPQLELPLALGCATRVDVDGSLVVTVDTLQRSDVTGVYVAGEATGVGGAELAIAEGELAGLACAHDSGVARTPALDDRARRLQRRIGVKREFAAAMHRAHPVPPGWTDRLTEDTVVCRCEEVEVGQVRHAVDSLGATDSRSVKLLSRTGMGWCQGRVCGFATAGLVAALCDRTPGEADLVSSSRRPFAAPVPLGVLARVRDVPSPGSSEPSPQSSPSTREEDSPDEH